MQVANPTGFTKTNCGPLTSPTAGQTTLSLTGGSITGGATCTVKVNVYVTAAGPYTNQIDDQGTSGTSYVEATNTTDGTVHNANVATSSFTAVATFSINKSFSSSTINANDPAGATLDISITAPANLGLTNVAFNDPLDPKLIPQTPAMSAACGGTPPSIVPTNIVQWAGGTVAAGQTCHITVLVTAANTSGTVTNALSAGAVTGTFAGTASSGSNSNNVSVQLGITGLSMTKKFQPDTVGAGGVTTMYIDFTNYATVPLTNLTFTDDLGVTMSNHVHINNPNQLLSTCGGVGAINATPGTAQVIVTGGSIPAALGGTPGTCEISVDIVTVGSPPLSVPGSDTNTISHTNVTTNEGISPIKDATATLNYAKLKLVVTKEFNPVSVTLGTPSDLIILLQNNQSVDLVGVSIKDDLPQVAPGQGMFVAASGATYDAGCAGTPTTTGLTLNSTSFTISGVDVPANSTCTITVVVSQNVATTLTNTIKGTDVTSRSGIQTPQDTSASLTYTAFLGVNKSFSAETVLSDQPVTLSVQFVNAYPNTLTMQSFTDDLTAAGGLKVAPTPNVANLCGLTVNATAGATSFSVTGGTLPANSSCIVSVDVVGNALKTYTNTINPNDVTTTNPGGNTIKNATGTTASVTVLGYYVGNRVWLDDGAAGSGTLNDGIINGTENAQGIDGVSVTLLGSDGTTPVTDGAGNSSVTTSGGGYYRFDKLPAGTYFVRIDAANWTGGTKPLLGLVSSTGDFNSLQNNAGSVNTLDNHDMGIDSTGFTTNGIKSGAVNLSYTTIPASESDTAGTRNSVADFSAP